MKNVSALVWLTQLGFSVVAPLAVFLLFALWLHRRFSWGTWIIWVGLILGILSAISGLRSSLAAMQRMSEDTEQEPPATAFNDHD